MKTTRRQSDMRRSTANFWRRTIPLCSKVYANRASWTAICLWWANQANEMFMTLMKQDASSIVFQNLSHIERVQALHARQCEAEEIVRHDVIFQPLPSEGLSHLVTPTLKELQRMWWRCVGYRSTREERPGLYPKELGACR